MQISAEKNVAFNAMDLLQFLAFTTIIQLTYVFSVLQCPYLSQILLLVNQ